MVAGYRAGAATIVADYLDRRIAEPDEDQISWDELWPYWAAWVEKDRENDGKQAADQQDEAGRRVR